MADFLLLGLIIYTFSVFGISWIVTQSSAFNFFRAGVRDISIATEKILILNKLTAGVDYLFNCIVCTSVWVGFFVLYFKGSSVFFSAILPPIGSAYDYIIWAGYIAGVVWIIAIYTDDADS